LPTKKFRDEVKLGAVNSINWCRVLAQTTYYFWTYLRVTDKHKNVSTVNFSVPTGNFGDILAGYYAKRMGLPVGRLIVATNENDILHRFFTTGEYHRRDIEKTISPSMDICVSSNFERYLFHLADDSSNTLADWMKTFEKTGKITVAGKTLVQAQKDFSSARADTAETLKTIKLYYEKYQYMLCPHSAVGVSAIEQLKEINSHTVCLATAHEAKFPAACQRAVDPLPTPPTQLSELYTMKTRSSRCSNNLKMVQTFMKEKIASREKGDQGKKAIGNGTVMTTIVAAAVITSIIMQMTKLMS